MGCSTSAPTVLDTNKEGTLSANKVNDNKGSSNMCDKAKIEDMEANKYPASEAFIIPLNDAVETKVYTADAPEAKDLLAATVKKQPPKRIQELIEQAAENEATAVNLQNLEEKLEKAEERRKEYLQQKIETIQKTTQMLTRSSSRELLEREKQDEPDVDGQMEKEHKNDNHAEYGQGKK
ncbi:PREDICTED: uncharacterized protein LOC108358323 isoform X2 [Rhagoletis zephyria]|uniref:uncharacterized protein LOC108358323 isoform X1 n=1 Tax=Rhagoletis zephyria TaxID=28612 RepID=UPI00081198FD|nr:PREDICTED: uncharacterized protein LOC108358323 isoform X1 [Rhagoletis zephyria]XP_017465080.1 PREDICTED: uncharacterized protein LOC108358323 isoform X2 [Rhagoletis zephyria]XP_017465081.1 PREDICTED: uncharacterized protein LOC108358323 isoform X2 [Rhagoletis zephyria]XP_017465082.1 PREDICTED: uncharacterized protein LOC108358323 isoform X2 [Rhagoletis zephyria]XP_017465083.1 PREDICTED: uncharacterized protein LOC108358323 isoform X2 [Rhagoletis zephyria]XP_017465084.1 PREDICTED: uncharact